MIRKFAIAALLAASAAAPASAGTLNFLIGYTAFYCDASFNCNTNTPVKIRLSGLSEGTNTYGGTTAKLIVAPAPVLAVFNVDFTPTFTQSFFTYTVTNGALVYFQNSMTNGGNTIYIGVPDGAGYITGTGGAFTLYPADSSGTTVNPDVTPTPAPAALSLLGLGVLGLAARRRG